MRAPAANITAFLEAAQIGSHSCKEWLGALALQDRCRWLLHQRLRRRYLAEAGLARCK